MSGASAQTAAAKATAEAQPTIEVPKGLAALREPFDQSQIGLLPKPYKKDAAKGECQECGKWHGLPAMHLDFVGHGAVTDRLLNVDPGWTWEPFATDDRGLPALDQSGNLWIRLTVCGVTRIGVGDGAEMKVKIGDAIRNAAMRFGVALDLWIRGQEDDHKDEPPPTWNAAMVKSRLVELTGSKEDAKDAWERHGGPALREFSAAAADAIYESWVNEDPADPGTGSPEDTGGEK